MIDVNFPEDIVESLASAIETHTPMEPRPLDSSPWVAMSLLQKAIRRGRGDLAQRAAATLLRANPDRLWRRLGVVAAEDVGLGDLAAIEEVAAASSGGRRRAHLGGEWAVASYLVARLASTAKCRAADDLLLVAGRHPAHLQTRLELGHHAREELSGVVSGKGSLIARAIALLYLLGTDRGHRPELVRRRGEPEAAFEALARAGCAPRLLGVVHELHRRTREPLGPLVALLSRESGWEAAITADDPVRPEVMVGEVPGWAYDMFTREGRAALGRFLAGRTRTARWIVQHVAPGSRLDVLGSLVFTVEGGQLHQRIRWRTGDRLRHQAEVECVGEDCPDATEVLRLLRHDVPTLNRLRRLRRGAAGESTHG